MQRKECRSQHASHEPLNSLLNEASKSSTNSLQTHSIPPLFYGDKFARSQAGS